MPELPEVEVILQHLKSHVLGATIKALTVHRSDIVRVGHSLIPWFAESKIIDVHRVGKCIVFICQRNWETRFFLSELGMTGLWFFRKSLAASPTHIHCQISLSDKTNKKLYYWNPRRFGRLWLFTADDFDRFKQRRFGPDASTITQENFLRLTHTSRARLKSLLLNQHRLAGIGNIYANEILFRAKIHPHVQGFQLTQPSCQRLHHTMQEVLREAIIAGGSSIRDFRAPDGSRGQFQDRHLVYQKVGMPCPNGCQAHIKRIHSERSSFFCPMCQKKARRGPWRR